MCTYVYFSVLCTNTCTCMYSIAEATHIVVRMCTCSMIIYNMCVYDICIYITLRGWINSTATHFISYNYGTASGHFISSAMPWVVKMLIRSSSFSFYSQEEAELPNHRRSRGQMHSWGFHSVIARLCTYTHLRH